MTLNLWLLKKEIAKNKRIDQIIEEVKDFKKNEDDLINIQMFVVKFMEKLNQFNDCNKIWIEIHKVKITHEYKDKSDNRDETRDLLCFVNSQNNLKEYFRSDDEFFETDFVKLIKKYFISYISDITSEIDLSELKGIFKELFYHINKRIYWEDDVSIRFKKRLMSELLQLLNDSEIRITDKSINNIIAKLFNSPNQQTSILISALEREGLIKKKK